MESLSLGFDEHVSLVIAHMAHQALLLGDLRSTYDRAVRLYSEDDEGIAFCGCIEITEEEYWVGMSRFLDRHPEYLEVSLRRSVDIKAELAS